MICTRFEKRAKNKDTFICKKKFFFSLSITQLLNYPPFLLLLKMKTKHYEQFVELSNLIEAVGLPIVVLATSCSDSIDRKGSQSSGHKPSFPIGHALMDISLLDHVSKIKRNGKVRCSFLLSLPFFDFKCSDMAHN